MDCTNEIKNLCLAFREAILRCPVESLPVTFERFPKGACGDTSLVLAKYLQNNGHDGFHYVLGWYEEQGHAWLERDGLIVDITADQFDEQLSAVTVTTQTAWYDKFQDRRVSSSDFMKYDQRGRAELSNIYCQILTHMND